MNAPTWLVLGASSSIARAFALEAAAQGSNVILAGRDCADLTAAPPTSASATMSRSRWLTSTRKWWIPMMYSSKM